MLVPAQLFIDELNALLLPYWYDMDSRFYTYGPRFNQVKLPDTNEYYHDFVSLDNDDKILGYISYQVDQAARSCSNLGIISVKRRTFTFAQDCYQAVEDIFLKYHYNRLEFSGFVGNPTLKNYEAFVKKVGGKEIGYKTECVRLIDGKLYDEKLFEILAKDFKPLRRKK